MRVARFSLSGVSNWMGCQIMHKAKSVSVPIARFAISQGLYLDGLPDYTSECVVLPTWSRGVASDSEVQVDPVFAALQLHEAGPSCSCARHLRFGGTSHRPRIGQFDEPMGDI